MVLCSFLQFGCLHFKSLSFFLVLIQSVHSRSQPPLVYIHFSWATLNMCGCKMTRAMCCSVSQDFLYCQFTTCFFWICDSCQLVKCLLCLSELQTICMMPASTMLPIVFQSALHFGYPQLVILINISFSMWVSKLKIFKLLFDNIKIYLNNKVLKKKKLWISEFSFVWKKKQKCSVIFEKTCVCWIKMIWCYQLQKNLKPWGNRTHTHTK